MSSIEDKILGIKFDNAQFEKGVGETLKSLGELDKATEMKGGSKGLENLARSVKDFSIDAVTRGIDTVSHRFSALGVIGATALQKITSAVMDTGAALIKSLTIDQVTAGFSKYEQKTGAVQTIMSATGKTIDEVNSELERLIWFSDETSYSFTDMVGNIAKFTSQNIELDKSVTAMQGIANWAAVSGQGTNEAARAMYNLSQALGKGSVQLIDWKSIENANMATVEFKQTVIDTAKELGVLDKAGKTLGGKEVNTTNFNENLKDGWFDTNVLMASLEKYGSYTDEIFKMASEKGITAAAAMSLLGEETGGLGEKAFKAAQQAKTFTEVINATKDAVSSGWMNTFEHIFGNYEEAVVLWSDLAQDMYEIFAEDGNMRNQLLQDWKEAGGRDDMISGLMDIIAAIKNIKALITDAFHTIFPETTVDQLLNMSKAIKEFGKNLKKATSFTTWTKYGDTVEKTVEKVGEAFGGTDLKKGAKNSNDEVKKLQERLNELGYDAGEVDGIFGKNTEAALKRFQKAEGLLADGIYGESVHNSLMEALGLSGGEETVIERVSNSVRKFGVNMTYVQNILKGVFSVFKIIGRVFKFIGGVIGAVLKTLQPLGDALLKILSSFGLSITGFDQFLEESKTFEGWLETITAALEPFAEWVKVAAEALLDLFGLGEKGDDSGGGLFGRLFGSDGEGVDLEGALPEGADGATSLLGTIVDKLKDFADRVGPSGIIGLIGIILGITGWQKLKGLGKTIFSPIKSLLGGLGELMDSVKGFLTKKVSILKIAAIVLLFAAGIILIAKAISILGEMDGDKLAQGAIAVTAILGAMIGLSKALEKLGGIKVKPSGMIMLGIGLLLMVAVIKIIGDTNFEQFVGGFAGLSAVLGLMVGLSKVMSKVGGVKLKMAGLIMLSLGLMLVVQVVKMIGSMSFEQFVGGFIGLTMILFLLIGAMAVLKKVNAGASGLKMAGIMEMAWGLKAIVEVIKMIGEMDPEKFIGGFIGLTAIVVLMIALAAVMKRLGNTKINFKGILRLALGLAAMVLVLKLVATMTPEEFIGSFIGLIAIVGLMIALAAIMQKIGNTKINFKGILRLALGLTAMVLVLKLVATMSPEEFIGSFIALTLIVGLMISLGAIMKKLGDLRINISGLIMMAIGLAAMVGVMKLIGTMSPEQFIGSFVGLALIMGLLIIFGKSLSSMPKISFKTIAGLMGMVIIIGILALCVHMLGSMKFGQVAYAIAGLMMVMLSFTIMAKVLSGINISGMIGGFVLLLGLAAVIWVFGEAMSRIKDIDASQMIAFAGSLSMLMLAFGAFAVLSMVAGPMGIGMALLGIIGLVAVVGLVIAALGAIGKSDAALSIIESAGKTMAALGEMVGSFTGAMKGAETKAFAESMKSFKGVEVDENAINETLKGAQALADFSNGLPQRDIGTRIADFLMGSNLKGLSNDIKAFGEGFKSFADSMSDMKLDEGLNDKVTAAIAVAQAISNFSSGLPEIPLIDKFTGWVTPMDRLSSDMLKLASGFKSYSDAVADVNIDPTVNDTTNAMLETAGLISTFSSGLPEIPLMDKLTGWVTPMSRLTSDMSQLVSGFKSYSDLIADLEIGEDVGTKTETILAIASSISEFTTGLPEIPVMDKLMGWASPMEQFNADLINLTNGFKWYSTALESLEISPDVPAKTTIMVETATMISTFVSGLPEVPVMDKIMGWATPMEQFNTDMMSLADGFKKYAAAMDSFEIGEGLDTKTTMMLTTATAIANFSTLLPETPTLDKIMGWATPMEGFGDDMNTLVQAFKKYANSLSDYEIDESVGTKTDAIVSAATAISTFTTGLPETPLLDRLTGWTGSITSLGPNMVTLVEAFKGYAEALVDVTLPEDLDTKTTSIIETATTVSTFITSLPPTPSASILTGWATPMTTLASDMKTLVKAIQDWGTELAGMAESTIVTDTDAALAAVTSISAFLEGLATINLDNRSGFEKFMGVTANTDSVFGSMEKLGESVLKISKNFSGIGDLESQISSVKTSITQLIDFLTWLSSDEVKIEDSSWNYKSTFDTAMGQMNSLGLKIKEFSTTTADVDATKFKSFMDAVGALSLGLAAMSGISSNDGVTNIRTSLDELVQLFSGDNAITIDSDSFLSGLDVNVISEKIRTAATTIATAVSESSTAISEANSGFNTAGSEIGTAIATGLEGNTSTTTALTTLMTAAKNTGKTKASEFSEVGKAMCTGMKVGLDNNASIVTQAAAKVASDALQAAKDAIDSASPAKKFIELGEDSDEGFAIGFRKNAKAVTDASAGVSKEALSTAKNALADFASILASDMDADPVIKPIVDLSDIKSGAKQIGGLMSYESALRLSSERTHNLASTIRVPSRSETLQNGNNSNESTSTIPMDPGVMVTGNEFVIRNDNDIRLLASELASHTKTGQRALGATT